MRPARLIRFYVAVPQDYEDAVAHAIGKLGAVELISRRLETGRREELEVYTRFLRLIDRVGVTLQAVENVLPKKEEKKSFMDRLKSAFIPPKKFPSFDGLVKHEDLIRLTNEFEEKLNKYAAVVDEGQKKLVSLKEIEIRVSLFKRHEIPLDIIGEYTHIFVKAGLIPIHNMPLLKDYLKPYNYLLTVKEGIRKDYLIVLAASQQDKEEILKILSMLNFDEIVFPKEYVGDHTEVLNNINREKEDIFKSLYSVRDELSKLYNEVIYYKKYVNFLHKVKSSVTRTRNLTIFDGWIEKSLYDKLMETISAATDGKFYIEREEPSRDYPYKPPTKLRNLPGFRGFEMLTRMRGVPDYFEIDPTPIFTILFFIMYGMMFGDVGEGIALFILGLIFYRLQKPMLGLSRRALNNLGYILMFASVSAIIYGFLYGESFLLHFMEPLWLNPLTNTIDIVIISIEFGLIQLIIAIVINIIISFMNREYLEAILSWKGILGLIYLSVGIYIAIQFITGGMTLSVFTRPDVLPFTITEIIVLVIVYLKPTIENIAHHHEKKITETLIEGLGEFIETFISYLTNSVSYIRLGAFAIAHSALAEAASIFAGVVGFLPSYIMFNILVTLLDGFAAGIQSMRLLFYEFSTKFYRDEGILFKPLKV